MLHRIHPADDVAVALTAIEPGASVTLDGVALVARDAIPRGHKLALHAIAPGEVVRKYGAPIGLATQAIEAGAHVHSHNLRTALEGLQSYDYAPRPRAAAPARNDPGFLGYRRRDGRVGTRNEIWILCTVGCVARTSQRVAAEASRRFAGRVDGIYAFPHPFGCSQLGDDLLATRRMLAALASHPNAGGVLILGLGCENNQLDALLADAPLLDRDRLRAFTAQSVEDEEDAALAAIEELVAIAERDRRTPASLGDLVLGLKCGGSDGFSGLTANPLVGRIADRVVAAGGTTILTEIPEIFGAERLLMARAATRDVFDGIVRVVDDFKDYFRAHGQPIYENPSPGNKDGGLTTLEEKSLGAVQKAGAATVTQVLRYGDMVQARGLALLESPGNDAVSSTALAAAGATLILFTTGRGTPLGFPAPTLKIATNKDLAMRKPHWIDFDAGAMLDDADATEDALLRTVLHAAAGAPTRAEQNGEREIALWKRGVTL
ncbi:UxaA family hydrolase [Roseiterribacter gracilis]|uniref:Altronate hydrolase n=1 Tax=Roseiterribacter gracilis TaxID=2812848 RepID=A0A8S8X8Q1_9PROT|nr:altronate hydrolase [Rhodospirillales bacterium TMPK1]